jgi:hypothetical protein
MGKSAVVQDPRGQWWGWDPGGYWVRVPLEGEMSREHVDLFEAAKKALNDLFSDRSVAQAETRDSLEELRDEIDSMLDTLPRR